MSVKPDGSVAAAVLEALVAGGSWGVDGFTEAQLFGATAMLVRRGWVARTGKRRFQVTDAGREALAALQARPAHEADAEAQRERQRAALERVEREHGSIEAIAEAHAAGVSLRRIGAVVGVSGETIRNRLTRLEVRG